MGAKRKATNTLPSLAVLLLLGGCRVQFDVPEGGHVESFSFDLFHEFCPENSHCLLNVDDFNYYQGFHAVPHDGYVFVRWQEGERHLGSGTTDPIVIDSSLAVGNSDLEHIVNSDETFFIRPVFALEGYDTRPVGVPTIYQIDCGDCQGPRELEWPVNLDYQRNLMLWGQGGYDEDMLILGTFILYANEYDYQIENVSAAVDLGEDIASFIGLSEGQVIRKGDQLIFSIATNAPDGPHASTGIHEIYYTFEFRIAGTDAVFSANVASIPGDRCPLC